MGDGYYSELQNMRQDRDSIKKFLEKFLNLKEQEQTPANRGEPGSCVLRSRPLKDALFRTSVPKSGHKFGFQHSKIQDSDKLAEGCISSRGKVATSMTMTMKSMKQGGQAFHFDFNPPAVVKDAWQQKEKCLIIH